MKTKIYRDTAGDVIEIDNHSIVDRDCIRIGTSRCNYFFRPHKTKLLIKALRQAVKEIENKQTKGK